MVVKNLPETDSFWSKTSLRKVNYSLCLNGPFDLFLLQRWTNVQRNLHFLFREWGTRHGLLNLLRNPCTRPLLKMNLTNLLQIKHIVYHNKKAIRILENFKPWLMPILIWVHYYLYKKIILNKGSMKISWAGTLLWALFLKLILL